MKNAARGAVGASLIVISAGLAAWSVDHVLPGDNFLLALVIGMGLGGFAADRWFRRCPR